MVHMWHNLVAFSGRKVENQRQLGQILLLVKPSHVLKDLPQLHPHRPRLPAHVAQDVPVLLPRNSKKNQSLTLLSNLLSRLFHPNLANRLDRPRKALRHLHHASGGSERQRPRGPRMEIILQSPLSERPAKVLPWKKKRRCLRSPLANHLLQR